MSPDNKHLILKRIKAGSANRYGDVIDTRVTKILEKAMPTQHNAQEFAQMRLTAQADYIVAEVLAGYFKVRTRGTRFPIKKLFTNVLYSLRGMSGKSKSSKYSSAAPA